MADDETVEVLGDADAATAVDVTPSVAGFGIHQAMTW